MGRQTLSERWRAWLEKVAQPQEDGTYVLHPWPLSSATYQVDVTTRDRWIRFLLGLTCTYLAAAIAILMVQSDDSLSTARVAFLIFSICGAVVIAQYVGTLVIFRHAQRVPKERWKAPAVVDRRSRFSRGKEITFAVMYAMVIGLALVSLLAGSADDFWPAVQMIVVFGALFLSSLLRLVWRKARAITMVRTAPVVLLFAWMAANAPARMWPSLTLVILIFGLIWLLSLLPWWRGRRTSS